MIQPARPEQLEPLLAQGLLSEAEVREARRLLAEATAAGHPLALPDLLIRAGVAAAKAQRAAGAASRDTGILPVPPGENTGRMPVSQPSPPEPAPDVQASGLRLCERLGRGTQAIVYKCHDVHTDRTVAAKILATASAGGGASAQARERFMQEARSAAKLSHPNVITIHRILPMKNSLCIIMEYVDGGTVADLLALHKRIDPAEALVIVRQVTEGLRAAHAIGLVHRDIKPHNIMLTGEGRAKLADMGLARHVAAADEAGKAFGTPYYMSPEQVTNDPPPDFRTDIYSLGATLYEMVTGRPPFTAATPQEIMRQQVLTPMPDPWQFAPDLAQPVCWLLAKMLAKEPEDRYSSAADLATAIDQTLDAVARASAPVAEVVGGEAPLRVISVGKDPAGPARPAGPAAKARPGKAVKPEVRDPKAEMARAKKRRTLVVLGFGLLLVVAVAAAGVLLALARQKVESDKSPGARPPAEAAPMPPAAPPQRDPFAQPQGKMPEPEPRGR